MIFRTLLLSFCLTAAAFAGTVTGTVTNKTTNKPAAGADVVASNMAAGMSELARAKTDSKGKFTLTVPDETTSLLIRVEYQGANYPKFIQTNAPSVDIDVYDAAKKVDGISGTADLVEFQTISNNELEAIETWVVRNDSKPPKTQLSEKTFEIYLPEGAEIESSAAGRAGGMPVNTAPVPQTEK
ncbi:MAG TPA: carboxypeptidase-like regulatory domain-containing protein, partial [Terriglobales bacterium]